MFKKRRELNQKENTFVRIKFDYWTSKNIAITISCVQNPLIIYKIDSLGSELCQNSSMVTSQVFLCKINQIFPSRYYKEHL